ncbi:MAG: hypothetical protein AAB664_02485, partial [Patescibacteria group bacterium]
MDTNLTVLPENVLDFLSDVGAVEFAQEFVKKYHIEESEVSSVMNLAEDITRSDISIADLPKELTQQFGLDDVTAKQAAVELAEARLLPVAEVIGDVRSWIQKWGGDLSVLPEVVEKGVSAESFVHGFVLQLPGEMPSHLENRLENFFLMYLQNPANHGRVVEDMMRSEKVGGLAFEKKDAENLLDYFDEKKGGTKFVKEIGGIDVGEGFDLPAGRQVPILVSSESKPNIMIPVELAEPIVIPKKIISTKPVEVVKTAVDLREVQTINKPSKPDAYSETDEKEIEEIKIKKQAALEKSVDVPVTVEEMIIKVCSIDSMRFDDQKLGDRCRQIVESRLREVRTAVDTQVLLEKSVDAGGLGVSGRKLSDMMQSIENGVESFQKIFAKKVEDDRKNIVDTQAVRAQEKKTLAEQEEKSMTKRYVAMTGKIPDAHASPIAPTESRVSGAVSQAEALHMREQKIDTAKVRSVIESAKPITP